MMAVISVPAHTSSMRNDAIRLIQALLKNLGGVQDLIDFAHPFVLKFSVIMGQIEQYISDAVSFLDFVDTILKALKEAVVMCKYLGQLIPEVGPILAQAASFIEKLRITQVVGTIVTEIKRIIKIVSIPPRV